MTSRHRTRQGGRRHDDREHEKQAPESIETFNRADWDALRAMLAPSFVYEETGSGRRIEGPDAVLTVLQDWKSAFPDAVGDVRRVTSEGDTTVLEILWRGTHTGPLDTGTGVIPASGRIGKFWGSMWQQWDGDLLVHERHHLDLLTMLANIGAIPAPA